MKARRAPLLVLGVLALAVIGGGLAWACTQQASLSAQGPVAGRPGTVVPVLGRQFADGRVELRWSSPSGPVLATAQGPSFAAQVVLPNAPPDYYTVVAVGRDQDERVVGTAPLRVQITSPGDVPGRQPGEEPTQEEASGAPGANHDSAATTTGGGLENAGRTAATASGGERSTVTARSFPGVGTVQGSSAGGTSGSVALGKGPAHPETSPGGRRESGEGGSRPVSTSERTALGDLWSGLVSPDASILPSATGTSPPTAGPSSYLALGIALLGLGVAGLLSGLTVARRRRRWPAR